MKLKIKKIEVSAGRPIVFLNQKDASNRAIHVDDRVVVSHLGNSIIARVDTTTNAKEGEIIVSEDILSYLKAKHSSIIDVSPAPAPKSSVYITKKMNGKELTRDEIFQIIKDIVNNALAEVEVAQFIVAVYKNGMSKKETLILTEAMYKTGSVLHWHSNFIADKHSIGGIAGNRTSPIVVSICAAAGVIMPKTSSRAITSAAGTADVMETITNVDFPSHVLRDIVRKTGACIAWGGALGIAPADDKLIKIERILNLDPEAQLLASIMSKKLAVGSKYVLIDIPFGTYAKVTKKEALKLKSRFLEIGEYFKLKMRVLLTNGNEPIGNGIGPVLEMLDILKVLERKNAPRDLEQKSLFLAANILEMVGKAKKGTGLQMAQELLDSGLALKKFNEIVNMQGRKNTKLKPAKFTTLIKSKKDGTITFINNKEINHIAHILGCPVDKAAGVYIYKHTKSKVKKGEPLLQFYSESREKLQEALYMLEHDGVIKVS